MCVWTTLVLVTARQLQAHAILVEASPKSGSTISGPNIPIRLRFNVRVDGGRSRIAIATASQGKPNALTLDKQTDPDVLTANASGLSAGHYKLQWQVLAADGHITRGEISFTVN
jgi:hypothetical protein